MENVRKKSLNFGLEPIEQKKEKDYITAVDLLSDS
jgi:hypothetical protein